MECREYQNYCDEYLSNILSPDLHDDITKHIEECEICGRLYGEWDIIRNKGLIPLSYEKGEPGESDESRKRKIIKHIRKKELIKKDIERKYVKTGYTGKLTGSTLDNYEIYEEIGKGGRGNVYRAKQISMDRIVALKVLKDAYAKDDVFINKFLKEARSSGRLNHVNMITVHHVGSAAGKYFFAMEYVDGETVQEMLARQGRIDPAEAVKITVQIINALDYAYSSGIIHRDVKPDNIMIDRMEIAKLADLGIATSIKEQAQKKDGSKKATGTPYFMSPEQVRGEELDFRTDIYSLGATLFHMVTGDVPFKGESTIETLKLRLREPPPSAREANPQVPPVLDRIIRRMMATDPEDRYSDYNGLAEALKKAAKAKGSAISSRPTIPSERKKSARPRADNRKTAAFIGIGIAAAFLLVAGIIQFTGSSPLKNRYNEDKTGISDADRSSAGDKGDQGTSPVSSDREARRKLNNLIRDIERSTDYENNIQRLKAFRSDHPRVRPSLVERTIRNQMDFKSRQVISGLKEKAMQDIRPYQENHDYGACLTFLNVTYKDKFAEKGAQREFRYIKDHIRKLARNRYSAVKKKADAYLAESKFGDSENMIKKALNINIPDITSQVNRYIADIEKRKKDYTARQKEKSRQRIAVTRSAFLDKVDPLIREKKFNQALRQCESSLYDPDNRPISALIKQKKHDCKALLNLYDKARERIKALQGAEYRFHLKKGGYTDRVIVGNMDNNIINLEISGSGGVQYGLKVDDLSFREILKLSEAAVGKSRIAEEHIALFLGHMIEGNMGHADKRLRAAKVVGIGNTEYYDSLLAERKEQYREEHAGKIIEQITASLKNEDYTALKHLVGRIENDFKDTLCYAEHKTLVDEARAQLDYYSQAGKMAHFFKGRVETENDRLITVRYDFSDEGQMEDWCPVLGTWRVNPNQKALTCSMGGPAKEKDWMVWTSIAYPFRFSGDIYFSATIELETEISNSWESCGLVIGKYRIELPRFINPLKNRSNYAGLAKQISPGSPHHTTVIGKFIPHVSCSEKQSFKVTVETQSKEGKAYLTVAIDGRALSVPLADGMPERAQLGFFSTRLSGVTFSDVVIRGTADRKLLDFIYNRERIRKALLSELERGRTIDLTAEQSRQCWINTGGLWEFSNNMLHGRSKGMMVFDLPLQEYEISAKIIKDPEAGKHIYNRSFHMLCGVDTERILRAGLVQGAKFSGWELGEALDFNRRYSEQEADLDELRKPRSEPIVFTVRYTQRKISYFLNNRKVFSCSNPHPLKRSCAGLMIEWLDYWFKDITLRKL